MNDFNICKNALAYFNFDLTQAIYDSGTAKGIRACNLKLNQAKRKVQQESSWSFLIQQIPLTLVEGEVTKLGYSITYALPTNLLRVTKVYSDEAYRRLGNKYLTNDPTIEIYGMLNTMPEDVPLDFEDLISLALAYVIAPIMSPTATDVVNQLIKQYSWTVESLISSDLSTRSKG